VSMRHSAGDGIVLMGPGAVVASWWQIRWTRNDDRSYTCPTGNTYVIIRPLGHSRCNIGSNLDVFRAGGPNILILRFELYFL
jgi:hypothetical protein